MENNKNPIAPLKGNSAAAAQVDEGAKSIKTAIHNLNQNLSGQEQRLSVPFEGFLKELAVNPALVIRNVFQVFHDMMKAYVGEGLDEYSDDPESIHFVHYDCSKLFVEGTDHPFFADRLFANRLISLVEAWKRGAQQNKIYLFKGPPGCGKSTFLNNLLMKFEEYTNTDAGMRYEAVWRFDRKILGGPSDFENHPALEKLSQILDNSLAEKAGLEEADASHNSLQSSEAYIAANYLAGDYVEVPCRAMTTRF